MLELAGDLRFLDEASFQALVVLVQEKLDGHFATDVLSDGTHDGAHAAAGDLAFDLVGGAGLDDLSGSRRRLHFAGLVGHGGTYRRRISWRQGGIIGAGCWSG